ncbi:MAG TPA: NAD(P)/FAD-dependent oxidoreductase [Steroidobacteraceae bacterium]|nr:NAD(P)/FAD-dependent oxidoreductase [Steroidobacteraceae bacterium]
MSPGFTIVGAGPVGTLLALLLARRGRRVRLLERRADPRDTPPERGRSINLALAARGIAALEQAQIMPRLAPHLVPMAGRMLHDGHGGLTFLRYGQRAHEVIHSISRERLNRVLIQAAAEHAAIDLQFSQRCLDVDVASATLQLRDERDGALRAERFEALLGADGAGSQVRAALVRRALSRAHEDELAHDYKELVIPARAASVGQTTTAYAFEPQALHIWPQGDHMLIALPNTDGSFTATLFLPRDGEPSFHSLRDAHAVRGFFQQRFADAAAAIPDLEAQFAQHPQGRLGTLHCDRWQVDGRVMLLGDAAHAIVPFHGQGLNCGFEDCLVLDRLLAHEQSQAAAFERFERQRQPDAAAIAAMALENYAEMRDTVRSAGFARRQRLAAELERRFPGRFIPRYSMVMFHPEMTYAEAQRRGARQERVLDALEVLHQGAGPLPDSVAEQSRRLLDEQGL